jgi:hypothetical protein
VKSRKAVNPIIKGTLTMKISAVIFTSSIALASPASAQYFGYPVRQPSTPLIRVNPYVAVIPGLPPFYGHTFAPSQIKPAPVVVPPVPKPVVTLPPIPTPTPVVKPPFVDNEDAQDRLERRLGKPDSDDVVMPFKGYHH